MAVDFNEHILKLLNELQDLVLDRDKKELNEAVKFIDQCKKDQKDLIQVYQQYLNNLGRGSSGTQAVKGEVAQDNPVPIPPPLPLPTDGGDIPLPPPLPPEDEPKLPFPFPAFDCPVLSVCPVKGLCPMCPAKKEKDPEPIPVEPQPEPVEPQPKPQPQPQPDPVEPQPLPPPIVPEPLPPPPQPQPQQCGCKAEGKCPWQVPEVPPIQEAQKKGFFSRFSRKG